jgi:hypothetical protein
VKRGSVGGWTAQALNDAANWLTGTNAADANKAKNQGGAKLFTWARLYELTRMPVVIPDTNLQNTCTIHYRSPLFPRALRLTGFYNNVLDFSETAENPFLIEWSFSFVVQSTFPDLNSISDHLVKVLSNSKSVSDEIDRSLSIAQRLEASSINFKNG